MFISGQLGEPLVTPLGGMLVQGKGPLVQRLPKAGGDGL